MMTNPEYVALTEQDLLVSKTDLKGIITFVNDDFIRMTGFSREELIGVPHNICRNRDVPKEVFVDLWQTLKRGESWRGLIKNEIKQGGFYWCVANIAPCYKNGQVVGYISIRTKADNADIISTEHFYRLFNQGKQGSLIIKRGNIVNNSLWERLSFFSNFTIKKRIITVITVLSLVVLTIGGLGLFAVHKNKVIFKSTYEDRTIPIYQISKIERIMLNNRILLANSLIEKSPEMRWQNTAQIETNIETISALWAAYMATYLTPEERVLANKFASHRSAFVTTGLRPAIAALRANNLVQTEEIIREITNPLFVIIHADIENLIQIQMTLIEENYANQQLDFTKMLAVIAGVVAFGFLLSILLGVALYRAIIKPLRLVVDLIKSSDNRLVNPSQFVSEISEVLHAFNLVLMKEYFYSSESKMANEKLAFQNAEKIKYDAELVLANQKLVFHEQRTMELIDFNAAQDVLRHQINHMQKLESIGKLTSGVAHDFNNILACMLGYNEMNKDVCDEITDEKLRAELENNTTQVNLAGNRATALIQKMLVYCRQDKTTETIDVQPTIEVIEEVLGMLRPALTSRIKLETVFESDAIIQIDATDLHQILTNLAVNARDAMQERGGIITISLKNITNEKTYCVACAEILEGNFVELSVADNGTGIEPEIIYRLFDPFFTTKSVGKGTGLGLSAVSGIVHNSHGHILVDSNVREPNQGATFRLLFPILNGV